MVFLFLLSLKMSSRRLEGTLNVVVVVVVAVVVVLSLHIR